MKMRKMRNMENKYRVLLAYLQKFAYIGIGVCTIRLSYDKTTFEWFWLLNKFY
jgi:hypothetical protein